MYIQTHSYSKVDMLNMQRKEARKSKIINMLNYMLRLVDYMRHTITIL